MESIVDHDLRERYEQDGFVLVKGALHADRDIGPFVAAYTRLINAMAYVYLLSGPLGLLWSRVVRKPSRLSERADDLSSDGPRPAGANKSS